MRFKIILTTAILFLFSFSVFAGMCFPEYQIYTNNETQVEKYTECSDLLNDPFGSLLNKLTKYPLSTTSFVRSKVSSTCDDLASNLQKLSFQDFSTFDKTKIVINGLFALLLVLLPLILLVIVSRKIQSIWIRIILDIVLILGYIPWLFVLSSGLGGC